MQRQLNPPVLTSQPARAKSFVSSPKDTLLNKPIATPPSLVHDFARIPIVGRGSFPVQPKLKINVPGDHYEQEADQMAEKALTGADQSNGLVKAVSPKISHSEGYDAPPFVNHALHDQKNNGSSMPAGVTSKMNNAFGFDFSSVRIHDDSNAAKLNDSIQAKAFTHGKDVYFNRGEYNPDHTEGSKLLAHELTHVVQQTSSGLNQSGPPQTIQRSFGGFFANIGRAIANIFTDELDYSDDTIQKYLAVLDTGKIEDDYDSDNKARVVVRKWKKGKLTLTLARRIMLIREMFSGWTADDDENAILDILKGSPGELTLIFNQIKPNEFRDEFQGSELKELDKILNEWKKRTGEAKAEDVNAVPTTFKTKTDLVGDDTPINEGITLSEFENYFLQQADWFTEDSLKADEKTRNQLWEMAYFLQEGSHVRDSVGNIKLADLIKATEEDMRLLRIYVAGAKENAPTIKIKSNTGNLARAVKLGKTMEELQSFVPGPVLRVVFTSYHLSRFADDSLVTEFRKYYDEFSPTLEHEREAYYIIELLTEGITPYLPLKGWVHDLHITSKDARLKLLDNLKDKSRSKPVLLILMSGLDHNSAFLQKPNLEAAILNTNNLTLLVQGLGTLKDFEKKVNEVADTYGQLSDEKKEKKRKGRIGQVVIAGHGSSGSVQLATKGEKPKEIKEKNYVHYPGQSLNPQNKRDDSTDLIDTILQRMDNDDAHVVFAGCLVGSHEIPPDADLKNTKNAAKVIRKAIEKNPNLRDQVEDRMKRLNVKGDVEAANASTTFQAFTVDPTGKAKLSLDTAELKDKDIGASKATYVQTGVEATGALRAALETWADEKRYGAEWTTKAMRTYLETYKDEKEWWRTITRTAYQVALPAKGNVDPAVLNDLSNRVDHWFNVQSIDKVNIAELDKSLKPAEIPIVFNAMLNSEYGEAGFLRTVIFQVWAKTDPTKINDFMEAIVKNSSLVGEQLKQILDLKFIEPHFSTILKTDDPANPSPAQMRLALTIAAKMGSGMPEKIKTLLKNAAGNKVTTSFPAALNVRAHLEGTSELTILRHIGLAPGVTSDKPSAPEPSADPKAAPKFDRDANADLDADKKTNESLVTVKPVRFILRADSPVMDKASVKANIIDTLKKGTVVRVAGTFAGWAMIDHGGSIGFVDLTLVAELK